MNYTRWSKKNFRALVYNATLLATLSHVSFAQPLAALVTPDNFLRAETDLYFGSAVKDGGFAKFFHHRAPTPIDQQSVIRMNRDTLYSAAVFDLNAGPVTITLPAAGKESNWVPTDPARKFELMARFYAPKPEFFDKKWILPDVEKFAQ